MPKPITTQRQAMTRGAAAFLIAALVGIAANGMAIYLYDWLDRAMSPSPWSMLLWRRREAFLEMLLAIALFWLLAAIPALAGGALYGRMLYRLPTRGAIRRVWAGCLAAGVMLAVLELTAAFLACWVVRFGEGLARWIASAGGYLLMLAPCSLVAVHCVGRWLLCRLRAASPPCSSCHSPY